MRRGISILLALMVGLGPLLLPLQSAGSERLPACCRRNGAHHCAMAAHMVAAAKGSNSITAPLTCPQFPRTNFALILPAFVLATAPPQMPGFGGGARVPLLADPAVLSGPGYTYAGRGPPANS